MRRGPEDGQCGGLREAYACFTARATSLTLYGSKPLVSPHLHFHQVHVGVEGEAPPPLKPWRPRARFTGGLHGYLFLVGDWPQRAREVSIELEVAEPTLKTDWELPVAVTDLRRVIRAQHLREEVVERRIA